MSHVVLIGDSVFDNQRYSAPQPDVAEHLRQRLGPEDQVTLLAVDGAFTDEVGEQIDRMPRDATEVFLSAGGNDALSLSYLLEEPVRSAGEAFGLFTEPLARFSAAYRELLSRLRADGRPLCVCTIYEGSFPAHIARQTSTAVRLFNDEIQRLAAAHTAKVIELRSICTEPSDFVNQIEPSGSGGRKIAEALAALVS
jgi:lysophospholipase L1-like esterase